MSPARRRPPATGESADQLLLSGSALAVFRLSGQFLEVAEELARPVGLTAARWQVIGAVLREPLPVAGIARAMGLSRQAVQRLADRVVEDGLAEYVPNPAHRRAKLLQPTAAGREAVAAMGSAHAELAAQLIDELGRDELAEILASLQRLSAAMDAVARRRQNPPSAVSMS